MIFQLSLPAVCLSIISLRGVGSCASFWIILWSAFKAVVGSVHTYKSKALSLDQGIH